MSCFCLEGRMTDVLKIPFLLIGGRCKPAIFFFSIFLIFFEHFPSNAQVRVIFSDHFVKLFSIFFLHFPRLGIRPTYPPNKEALFCLLTGYTLYCNVVETILYWKIEYFFRNASLSLLCGGKHINLYLISAISIWYIHNNLPLLWPRKSQNTIPVPTIESRLLLMGEVAENGEISFPET